MFKVAIFLITLLVPVMTFANYAIVGVGEAELEKDKVVFQKSSFPLDISPNESDRINKFINVFKQDFSFYVDKFEVLDDKNFIKNDIKNKSDFIYWINKNVNILFSFRFWLNKTKTHY